MGRPFAFIAPGEWIFSLCNAINVPEKYEKQMRMQLLKMSGVTNEWQNGQCHKRVGRIAVHVDFFDIENIVLAITLANLFWRTNLAEAAVQQKVVNRF